METLRSMTPVVTRGLGRQRRVCWQWLDGFVGPIAGEFSTACFPSHLQLHSGELPCRSSLLFPVLPALPW